MVRELDYQLGWVLDDTRYSTVPARAASEIPFAQLTDAHVATLLQRGLVREIDPASVRGGVRMFTVPELAKGRLRPIRHTADVNDSLPGVDPEHPVAMVTKPGIVKLVHSGEWMAAHDLAGWFDQIAYTPEIGARFCFRSGDKCYALTCLAMGQRQSVGVASAVTRRLLDFPRHSAACEIVIDNIVFVGTREDVIADSIEFRRRCAAAGAVLNDLEVPVEQVAAQRGEWCGIALDFVNKTVALTNKSIERTALSWSLRDRWTWRGYQACLGLLFWSYGIIDVPVHDMFNMLRFLSRTSADLTARPDLWDAPAAIWPSALADMASWVELIARNEPRKVPVDIEPEWLLCSDASRWGWGYVAVNSATNEVRTHGAPWSAYMERTHGDKLGSSTFAEPHGVVNSVCHLFTPRDGVRRILIATDNTATRWSFERGFSSHALHLNQCIGRLKSMLPGVDFKMTYVPGADNPADGPSRGAPIPEHQLPAMANSLRRVVGYS